MITTMFTLSTAHLTPDTCNRWLHGCSFAAFPKGDYGWFVYVPDDLPGDIPSDLAECIALARGQNCDWLMFDRDADTLGILPVYDWDAVSLDG